MSSNGLRLLGFDVRLHREDYVDSTWNEERRNSFLLSPKIKWPLSVDTLVWPSAFFAKLYGTQPMIAVEAETEHFGYWLNLAAMRAAVSAGWKARMPNRHRNQPAWGRGPHFGPIRLACSGRTPHAPGVSRRQCAFWLRRG